LGHIDITGQRFGRWVALTETLGGNSHPHWLCRCDCGAERVLASGNLRSGRSQSCGCLRREAPLVKPGQDEPLAWVKSHVSFDGDECLPWPFARSHGYGMVVVEGIRMHAHRYVCQCVNGPPPTPGHYTAHSCGRGRDGCVNPRHLRWATPAENSADMLVHGTRLQGERHPMAKLNAVKVARVRHLLAKGWTQQAIADLFDVERTTITLIAWGYNWSSQK
jgi:hypothetical protein